MLICVVIKMIMMYLPIQNEAFMFPANIIFIHSCPSISLRDLFPAFGTFDGDIIGHYKV